MAANAGRRWAKPKAGESRAIASWRRTCLGQVVWHPRIAYGRVLAFELGEPSLVLRQEASVPKRGDPFPPPRSERARAHVAGAWSCWVDSEVWELRWQNEVALTCTDRESRKRIVLSHLRGQRLVDVRGARGEISLVFNGGLEVRVHPADPPRTSGPFGDDVLFSSESGRREVGFNSLTSPMIRTRSGKFRYRTEPVRTRIRGPTRR